jgi:hypothetical protein
MDAALIAELNARYTCPADAGPAWRKACEMGMDMSLVERNLTMTPWERLRQNDEFLALVRMVQASNPVPHGELP